MITRARFIKKFTAELGADIESAEFMADKIGLKVDENDEEAVKPQQSTAIPRLVYKQSEVHEKLNNYLVGQQLAAQAELTKIAQKPPQHGEFLYEGVQRTCFEILSYIQEYGGLPAARGGCPVDGGEYARQWAYTLLSYCSDHGQPPTEALMDLVFMALDCKQGCYTPQGGPSVQRSMADDLDLDKARVKQMPALIMAAGIEGRTEIDEGEKPSANSLARDVGVQPSTIIRWRDDEHYQRKVEDARRLADHVSYLNC